MDARITRQSTGIFRVVAKTPAELYQGLGFCHGTDRALQMLMLRILGQGRASECLAADERMLGVDQFFRKMAFSRGLGEEVRKLDSGERHLIDAYCAGVNAALAKKLPWELRLLGYKPEPWTPGANSLTRLNSGSSVERYPRPQSSRS